MEVFFVIGDTQIKKMEQSLYDKAFRILERTMNEIIAEKDVSKENELMVILKAQEKMICDMFELVLGVTYKQDEPTKQTYTFYKEGKPDVVIYVDIKAETVKVKNINVIGL